MATHRYWRILILTNSSNVASISRLEFRQTSGGTDVAPGNTVITTGSWTDSSKVFDGSDSTFGFTNTAASRSSPFAIGVDFGASSGGWKDITEIAIRNRSDFADQGPTNVVIQSSDDNSAWTTEWMFLTANWTVTGTVRVSTKPASNPTNYVVFDTAVPPIDSGPFALTLTPSGNATVTSGKFAFDGSGDFYSATPPPEVYRTAYLQSIDITGLVATGTGVFRGIITIGTGNNDRLLLATLSGSLELWEGADQRISVASVLSSTPVDVQLVINGTTCTLYVNGSSIGSGTFARGDFAQGLTLGTDTASTTSRSLLGGFGRVRITQGLSAPAAAPTAGAGSASGTGTATGVGEAIASGNTAGASIGHGLATGALMALGVIGSVGGASGFGVAHAVPDTFRPVVGSSTGSGAAVGRAAALGTISTVGTAVGTGGAGSGSFATGVIAAAGASASVSTAIGTGSGRLQAAGSATATSTAVAAGSYVPSPTVGGANGTGTAVAIGRGVRSLVAAAAARADVLGAMAAVRLTVGSASGHGSALAVTNATTPGAGSATATSTATAVGVALKPAVGTITATSSVLGVATGLGIMRGVAGGTSAVAGISQDVRARAGVATATSAAQGVSTVGSSAVGTASATSSVTGVIRAFSPAAGTANATSSATAVSTARSDMRGIAHAQGAAIGVGVRLWPGLDDTDIVVVAIDGAILTVDPPDDPLLVVAADDAIVVVPFDSRAVVTA